VNKISKDIAKSLENHFDESGLNYKNELIQLEKPYTIVTGHRGIGKTSYIKALAVYNKSMQYLEVQRHRLLTRVARDNAVAIIEIRDLKE
jgi:recombinational DNA repair ATPase RecF